MVSVNYVTLLIITSSGLIHANHGKKIVDYLEKELRSNPNEVLYVCNYIQTCMFNNFNFNCTCNCRLLNMGRAMVLVWLPWEQLILVSNNKIRKNAFTSIVHASSNGLHKLYIKYGYTINLKTFNQYKFRPSVRE